MKKLSLITVILIFSFVSASSQSCLPEGITFTTQAQIDSFQTNYPNCSEIEGDVEIDGDDITNLNGLNVLTSIGGYLSIGDMYEGNPSLTDLTGLDSLTTVCGPLNIKNNDSLVSLTGLENLTSVHGISVGLILYNAVGVECFGENPRLESIAALSNLTSIEGDIEIFCNHSLTSLLGLENISSIAGNLVIAGNYTLANLDALFNLDTIYGSLEIGIDFWNGPGMYLGNPNLTNLSGLSNLLYIGGDLNIERNESLTSLSGLNSLTGNVNNIEIIGNHSLTSLMGLDNLDAGSINNLTITCNSSLSSCKAQGICDYLANPCGIVEIYDNAPGCNNPGEVANACGFPMPCLPYGNYYFKSQADTDSFPVYYSNCTDLQGNVTIGGSDISNLSGLTAVTSVAGSLYIGNNDTLVNLSGLDNLTSIGGDLYIYYNETLVNLSGLDNVTSISGQLWIVGNGDLTRLTGLENIDPNSITGLDINNNSSLSICAVQSICDYLAAPNGCVNIWDNAPGCNSQEEVEMACEGEPCPFLSIVFDNQSMIDNFRIFFPDCNEIDGDILIEGNNITSLAGLGNLTSIGGDLNIGSLSSGNPYLSILEGLDKLTNLGGNLHIHTNPILTSLTGLNNLETIGKRLIIWSNDSLTSIASLENLSSIGTDLIIMNNNSLSICSAWGICYYLSNPIGNVGIWDNAPGCNSREEVEEACTESVDEVSIINNLSIYPNPFTNTITIEYELKQPEIVTITIYNYLGEQLEMMRERMSVGQQKTEWNCAEISAGIYFCVLKTNKGIQTTKIIKL
ncbi:MAG: T9SS type A sorting domain-containing protein [Bacteroidales bacterium]|nr:T9SS type A sorting domain-containing protein [Bacteroidales bacterium]